MRYRDFKNPCPWVPSFLACCLFTWVQIVRAEPCPQSEPKSEEAVPSSGATLQTAKTIYIEPMPFDLHVYIAAELDKWRGPFQVSFGKSSADLWMDGTAEREKKSTATRVLDILSREKTPDVLTTSVRVMARGGHEVLWTGDALHESGSSKEKQLRKMAQDLMAQLRDAVWHPSARTPHPTPAEETGEPIPQSGATLQTAQTIYIEPMPYNLHMYLVAEFNKQKGPYRVSLSKREADLWMRGTAEVHAEFQPRIFSEMAKERGKEEAGPVRVMTTSVFITARGGQEALWAESSRGAEGNISHVAGGLVKKLRKFLKQD